MKKIIYEGEALPKYYGVAYPNLTSLSFTCYIFPLNHVVSFLRKLWFKIRDSRFAEEELRIIQKIQSEKDELNAIRSALQRDREDFDKYKILLFQGLKDIFKPKE